MNKLLKTIDMLIKADYKNVGIIMNPSDMQPLYQALGDANLIFTFSLPTGKFNIYETSFTCFSNSNLTQLRGCNFDALVVNDKPHGLVNEDVDTTLRFGLRLGDNPLLIYLV